MPCPRRSYATSRNSSASGLSYCFAQQRWFCDHPWMNRIGGPSALPHSRSHAVPAEVVRDEPELVRERALVLLRPTKMVLRPPVDEQDRRPVRVAPLPIACRAGGGRTRRAGTRPRAGSRTASPNKDGSATTRG